MRVRRDWERNREMDHRERIATFLLVGVCGVAVFMRLWHCDLWRAAMSIYIHIIIYIVTNRKTYHFAQDMSWVFHGNERERKILMWYRGRKPNVAAGMLLALFWFRVEILESKIMFCYPIHCVFVLLFVVTFAEWIIFFFQFEEIKEQ